MWVTGLASIRYSVENEPLDASAGASCYMEKGVGGLVAKNLYEQHCVVTNREGVRAGARLGVALYRRPSRDGGQRHSRTQKAEEDRVKAASRNIELNQIR